MQAHLGPDSGGGVDMPLAAFAFEINEVFQYHYNLFVPWMIDCRIESRSLVPMDQPLGTSLAAGDEHHDVEAGGGTSRRTPR